MNVLGIFVSLICSLSFSFFDTSRKQLAKNVSPVVAVAWLAIFQSPIFFSFYFFETWIFPSSNYWLPALGSLAMNLVSNVLFIESVKRAPISVAIPVLSLTPVFAVVGAYIVLGEKTTSFQALGIVLTVAAVFILGRSANDAPQAGDASYEPSQIRVGLYLMVLVAALFAFIPLLDKICLKDLPVSEHAFLQSVFSALIVAIYLIIRRRSFEFGKASEQKAWMAAATFFAAIALFSQLWGITQMPVALFETLKRSFGLIAALVIGAVIFKERITKAKLFAVLAIGVGVLIVLN